VPEDLIGAATRIKRRAALLAEAEARARRGSPGAREEAQEQVHALCDAKTVFDDLLMQKQREYGVRVGP
jgi:hypothetical protein